MNSALLFAAGGGFAVNVLHLMEYAGRPRSDRPDFRDWLFWLPYGAWPALGALLAYAYLESGVALSPIIALNVGLSAPLILRAMIEANPIQQRSIDPGPGA
jgi:hypothetical protein